MFLAIDLGGTKVTMARFEGSGTQLRMATEARRLSSRQSPDFLSVVRRFLDGEPCDPNSIRGVGIGVAGPVVDRKAKLTNLPWTVDASRLERELGVPVFLLNDLEAHAYGIPVVEPQHYVTLRAGDPDPGNQALIAAGTGLGEAILFWDGKGHVPRPSEGSHADFGPADAEDVALLQWLWERDGHVSWERVCSGREGLRNLYDFLTETGRGEPSAFLRERAAEKYDVGEAVVAAAREDDPLATRIVEWFVRLYGAEAGNLALKALAVEGVFVSGGIAPHVLPWLKTPAFLDAFCAKGRFRELLERVPVHVITDPSVALKGAARYAHLHCED